MIPDLMRMILEVSNANASFLRPAASLSEVPGARTDGCPSAYRRSMKTTGNNANDRACDMTLQSLQRIEIQ